MINCKLFVKVKSINCFRKCYKMSFSCETFVIFQIDVASTYKAYELLI